MRHYESGVEMRRFRVRVLVQQKEEEEEATTNDRNKKRFCWSVVVLCTEKTSIMCGVAHIR